MYILASDFDNTFYFRTGAKKKDLEAIKRFQSHGHKFGFSTGRTLNGVIRPTSRLKLKSDFYVTLSGSCIHDGSYNELQKASIDIDIFKKIEKEIKADASIIENGEFYYYFSHPLLRPLRLLKYMRVHHLVFSLKRFKKPLDAFSFHFYPGGEKKALECTRIINEKYGNYVHAFTNKWDVDVAQVGYSKGKSVEFIKNYYNETTDHLYVIGDNYNDLPMFEVTPHSFTFPYAPKEVQDKAKYIVNSIAEAIEIIEKEEGTTRL